MWLEIIWPNTRYSLLWNSSDDPYVMAGLGTVGVEIITQLPETDAVIVPVASGALLASVLIACKKLKCSCLVYVSLLKVYCDKQSTLFNPRAFRTIGTLIKTYLSDPY